MANHSHWTHDDDCELRRLRTVEKRKWSEIADILRRTDVCCRKRYVVVTDASERFKSRHPKQWLPQDEEELKRLRHVERKSTLAIAEIFGRTVSAIQCRLNYLAAIEARDKAGMASLIKHIPQSVIDDRDRRMMAERDLTAILCGDPRPGQSALDRRQLVMS